MIAVEARHILKTITVGQRVFIVLDDVSLKANSGEFLVVSGTSGSRKTLC